MDPRERARRSWENWDEAELKRELAPWPVLRNLWDIWIENDGWAQPCLALRGTIIVGPGWDLEIRDH